MTRRCSHCNHNGHNARTCPSRSSGGGGSVRLFGVSLTEGVGPIKKSASMSCIDSTSGASGASVARRRASGNHHRESGYMSDDPVHASCSSNCRSERKKGTPWTEQEHRMFLRGLQNLGKGDWRGISRNYVVTRTPTQVASHAQKYFLRQSNVSSRKRRTSLFDMLPDMPPEPAVPVNQQEGNPVSPFPDQSRESCFTYTPPIPPSIYASGVAPHLNPVWFSSNPEILKTTAACGDEVAPMSNLQINDAVGKGQASLCLNLLDPSSSRQPAFHAGPSLPDLNNNSGSIIHAL